MSETKGQKLAGELSYKKKNYFETANEAEKREIFSYAEGYKAFLDAAKTEREACAYAVSYAKKRGFTEYRLGDPVKAGDKKYFVNRGKRKTDSASSRPISTPPASTSSRIRSMRTAAWRSSKPIITAGSRNTNGRRSRSPCTAPSF